MRLRPPPEGNRTVEAKSSRSFKVTGASVDANVPTKHPSWMGATPPEPTQECMKSQNVCFATSTNTTSPLGRQWSNELPLPKPSFPFGDGGCPSPYPRPLDLDGGGARGESAHDGPRWLQEGPREATSNIAQDNPIWFNIVSSMPPGALKTAPGRLQVPSESPKEAPKRPKSFKTTLMFPPSRCFVCIVAFRF